MRRAFLFLPLFAVTACAANGGTIDGGGPDASLPDATPDATPDGAPMDGAMPMDGSTPDAMADADAGAVCVCPGLPACTGAMPDTPAFAPEGTAFVDQLFQVIACADTTLDMAIYETTYDCVVDALVTRLTADSGLTIRLVIDDDMCPLGAGGVRDCALSRIADNPRVTIVDDARSALMHHKFIIADGEEVWVGSGNMTRSSFCTDYNNSIVVTQSEIVAGYQAAFDQMFGGDFSPQPVAPGIAGGSYTLYTSPRSPISSPSPWFDALVTAIDDASTKVEVMISAWTRTEVSDALIRAHGRGLTVRALVRSSYVDDPPAQALIAAGIEVRHDNVHSKVAIIDDHLVFTGSPNWSMNAWSNSEGSLLIDDATVAAAYAAELARAWPMAATP